jgi:hypothetical protein
MSSSKKFTLPLTVDKTWPYSFVDGQGERMPQPSDLLQGTLDMLILRAIANEPQHGWAIAQRIQQVSNNVLQIGQGSLYPALHRLVREQPQGAVLLTKCGRP